MKRQYNDGKYPVGATEKCYQLSRFIFTIMQFIIDELAFASFLQHFTTFHFTSINELLFGLFSHKESINLTAI